VGFRQAGLFIKLRVGFQQNHQIARLQIGVKFGGFICRQLLFPILVQQIFQPLLSFTRNLERSDLIRRRIRRQKIRDFSIQRNVAFGPIALLFFAVGSDFKTFDSKSGSRPPSATTCAAKSSGTSSVMVVITSTPLV
jgi:hypothetical protein